jgi:hypothetical protein
LSRRRARLQRAALPLSYSSSWTRPRESNPFVAVLLTAAFPLGKVGGLAPGEGLEPPSRGSEPRVLPVRPPWCFETWRPRRGSNPPPPARQAVVPPGDHEGATKKRGDGAPGRIRTSTAAGHGVTARWVRLRPSRRAYHHACLACHAYSVFNVRVPDFSGQKERGLASPGPLLTPLFSRESSNCSHRGDYGPGDARMGSCQRTMRVLAGYSDAGRRPWPATRLLVPMSSFCLWLSWHRGAYLGR